MRPIDADKIQEFADKAQEKWGNHRYLTWSSLKRLVDHFPTITPDERGREASMRCEKCGKEISHLMLSRFERNGSDNDYPHPFEECEEDAVVIETTPDWTGYELSEEEQAERIWCPHCGAFPFKNTEVQVYTFVRVVCFKSDTEVKT